MLNDVEAGKYIHGVAVHWYLDGFVSATLTLGATHHIFPEYYLFGTEACAGWSPLDRGVKLGSWQRAEQYAHDIIEVRSSSRLRNCCCARALRRIRGNGCVISRWIVLDYTTRTSPSKAAVWVSRLQASYQHSSQGSSPAKQAETCVFGLLSPRSDFSVKGSSETCGVVGGICLCRCVALET